MLQDSEIGADCNQRPGWASDYSRRPFLRRDWATAVCRAALCDNAVKNAVSADGDDPRQRRRRNSQGESPTADRIALDRIDGRGIEAGGLDRRSSQAGHCR